ncbi:hypothetical protein N8H74_25430 [Pseudomonas sp. B2M1-30]|uniref:hypothetical protein n=1 Tax=Pseudomonas TaxID=286 RepID=UPI0021C97595|nr:MULTISPECIES: hypothetical protein [Pseudomonas]MCU0121615.1 hypothetical protein [Pseudomonas sp. B2M1-30]MCU7261343.1 hypothetical protein [Pseudomonas koreensis]
MELLAREFSQFQECDMARESDGIDSMNDKTSDVFNARLEAIEVKTDARVDALRASLDTFVAAQAERDKAQQEHQQYWLKVQERLMLRQKRAQERARLEWEKTQEAARQESQRLQETARQESQRSQEAARQESQRSQEAARQEFQRSQEAARQEWQQSQQKAREEWQKAHEKERREREKNEVIARQEREKGRKAYDIAQRERDKRLELMFERVVKAEERAEDYTRQIVSFKRSHYAGAVVQLFAAVAILVGAMYANQANVMVAMQTTLSVIQAVKDANTSSVVMPASATTE